MQWFDILHPPSSVYKMEATYSL